MHTRIKLRFDDYENWISPTNTPRLEKGEFGVVRYGDTDSTTKIEVYVGDTEGGKPWNECPQITEGWTVPTNITDLLDVQLNTNLQTNDFLIFDGENWVNYDFLSNFTIDSDGKIDVATQTFAEQILQTIQSLSECVDKCCSLSINSLEDIQNVNISTDVQNGDFLSYMDGIWTNSNSIDGGTFT